MSAVERFSDSIQTLALSLAPNFMSSFPGRIIFGEGNSVGFISRKFFIFDLSTLNVLYYSIVEITKFLASEKERDVIKNILSKDNVSYFWIGRTITDISNESLDKIVTFVIEFEGERSFELKFSIPQLDNFYCALKRSILMILCLKDAQYDLMFNVTLLPIENIELFKKDREKAKKFVNTYINIPEMSNLTISNCIELLQYYNDILIIVHKITKLCTDS